MTHPCFLLVIAVLFCWHARLVEAAYKQEERLPDVHECNYCFDCVVDRPYREGPVSFDALKNENFQPVDAFEKGHKPNCTRCRGCSTKLEVLHTTGQKVVFGTRFHTEAGSSPNWLFTAPMQRTARGVAVVKVSCVPFGKNPTAKFPGCFPHLTIRAAKIYLAIDKLARGCGLTDVVPRVWVEPVNAIIPGVGYHIRWHAVWMELARGISLEALVRLGDPPLHPNKLLQHLHETIDTVQVVKAAVFDLLTSQCDRHAQNIFMDDSGSLQLIDNERGFYENRECALDSILLPTTQKYTINVMENAWVSKFRNWGDKEPKCWANPPLLLDYRCYVPGGRLGTNYPPTVKRCLKRLNRLSAKQVYREFGFPDILTATALKNRSADMLHEGFEYALMYGYPRNANPRRYKFLSPCCKIVHTDTYRCAEDWPCDTSLPYGNPYSGKGWSNAWPDPGTFEGGSVF